MRQFRHFKERYPQCVLFFRMGDFYETFYDDAKLAHKVLGVTLTQRTKGIPMAGVPYHSVDGYLRRMIEAGYRVAVCDQVEEPSQAKGVVRREVTRVITPGTLTDEALLEEGRENPLAAIFLHDNGQASIAWAELSTGSFSLATVLEQELTDELARIAPSELLCAEPPQGKSVPDQISALNQVLGCAVTLRPPWQFRTAEAVETLCKQFRVTKLAGFGLSHDDLTLGVASAVVHYLLETQAPTGNHQPLAHLRPPRRFMRDDYLIVDQVSLRNLEVESALRSGGIQGSLLGVLQDCLTAMGKRTLRQWLCYPLCRREAIQQRQRVVGAMVEDDQLLTDIRRTLDDIQDIERIIGRISVGRATPRDLVALGTSAGQAQTLAQLLADRPSMAWYYDRLVSVIDSVATLADRITKACVDAPPVHLREGGLIRDGYDESLDQSRRLWKDSHAWLANYQKQLASSSGISNLKLGFNKVFGYYIEVTAANKNRAPEDWSRKQTLKNAERYTTTELKQFEGQVLTCQQRAIAREQELFVQLTEQAQSYLAPLRQFTDTAAQLDVLACFAQRAVKSRYVQPKIVDEPVLRLRAGRHPVLDQLLGDQFVPNDVLIGAGHRSIPSCNGNDISGDNEQGGSVLDSAVETCSATLSLITGPNMAGKSTYIRQAALITLMAHTGSFVPAEKATIGLCDRIFTRIGASDELHSGQSTFMVEMTEAANICHYASHSSLIILDEIGRGTSTLDGLSLAWAIAEHLAQRRSRTFFATHYHELTGLADQFENVANLHVTVREWNDQVVFLHRIVPGATDRSYGIYVARIAGLPTGVIARANELLGQLSVSHDRPACPSSERPPPSNPSAESQLPLFTEYLEHPVIEKLRDMDLDQLTPMAAFDLLRQIYQEARQSRH